ncbi:hypothetical protein Q1695_006694 [Nippostrongylus brasiliensis]|nr:hypothetical protein Q1695_006694 [Nippostrongylus brasiliensis]
MKMNIRLKIMDQTDHRFEVDDQTLLSDFRLQVAERLHIPPDRQRIIFAGHVLKNENSTLSACGLQDGHVVHLVERPADMPFLPTEGETNDAAAQAHQHNNHHHHGRFFQNMFGHNPNERERVVYVIPFERSGAVAENPRIEELVRSAIANIPYLTEHQRGNLTLRWETPNSLHIVLPAQRNPHLASPALERVAIVEGLLDQIAHFHRVVEGDDGIVDKIDEFLEGTHLYNQENTVVMNEQIRAVALSLESEPLHRSRLIATVNSEQAGEDESDEHAARYQRVEETNGSPGFVMRHAITQDLVDLLTRLRNEQESLRPHLIRYERILNSRVLYNIDDEEHTDTDYRANFFTVYMEHVQRVLHRLSHAWHLTSDLSVYLHTPIPRRLLPNYQQFQLLAPTEGEIILEFHALRGSTPSEATTNEPSWRFLEFPPPGADVQELTSDEVRIMGMNPTIRRMQQLGIAVPIPIHTHTAMGQVNVHAGPSTGHPPQMMPPRRFFPPRRNGPASMSAPPPFPGGGVSNRGTNRPEIRLGSAPNQRFSSPGPVNARQVPAYQGASDTVAPTGDQEGPSLEQAIVQALEQGLPSEDSPNPYERLMRTLLHCSTDSNVDIAGILRSHGVQRARKALNRGLSSAWNSSDGVYSSRVMSPTPPGNQRSAAPSLGSMARGVISQTGGEVPFMSEVISNIMRSNGLGGAVQPYVDVIMEYGEAGPPADVNQGQQQVLNMAMSGLPPTDDHGRPPTAISYHVDVHQFEIFRHPAQPEAAAQESQDAPAADSSNVPPHAPSTSAAAPLDSARLPPFRNGVAQNRQRQRGTPSDFPFIVGSVGFPSEMHFMAPRQDIVSVDPFLSCTSRFTDAQRVIRNSHPNPSSHQSPYRRLLGDALSSDAVTNRRAVPINDYERVVLGVGSSGDIVITDENLFENFVQLAVRSALSRMAHLDQDRNSQNARGGQRVFPGGSAIQLPGGGEIVQATVSAPVFVRAEIEQHPLVHSDSATGNVRGAGETSQQLNGVAGVQSSSSIPEVEEGRAIISELANSHATGMNTRLTTILDSSHAPSSMLRPGNGSGIFAQLEALVLNFATLGDVANMISMNFSPLETHRSRFRAHVIENQLNGNSMPSADDLLSASTRLAALRSSIASVVRAAGGDLERDWNGRRVNLSSTIHNVEVAAIQQLLRAVLDRNSTDAEFCRRVQNVLRDYVRHLVALGNHSFSGTSQDDYMRIAHEFLNRADRNVGVVDVNLRRLLHLRNCFVPRLAAALRDQGRFPNLDEIPSRLFVWSTSNEHEMQQGSVESARQSSAFDQSCNGMSGSLADADNSNETEPSTSRDCTFMSAQAAVAEGDAQLQAQLRSYDGNWQRSFPNFVETIERDILSAQTNPRQLRNPSDAYQTAYPEQARRMVVPDRGSEEDVLQSALRETLRNVFRGNVPAAVTGSMNSGAVLGAFGELMECCSSIHEKTLNCDDIQSAQCVLQFTWPNNCSSLYPVLYLV